MTGYTGSQRASQIVKLAARHADEAIGNLHQAAGSQDSRERRVRVRIVRTAPGKGRKVPGREHLRPRCTGLGRKAPMVRRGLSCWSNFRCHSRWSAAPVPAEQDETTPPLSREACQGLPGLTGVNGGTVSHFCINLPRPGPRLRAVIIILIYLAVSRFAAGDAIPLAAGAIMALLGLGPAPAFQSRIRPAGGR